MKRTQKGFSVVEVLIVIVVLCAVAGVGYFAYNRISANKTSSNTSESTTAPAIQTEVADINTAEELDKTSDTLNEIDTESSDAELDQLDETLNTF